MKKTVILIIDPARDQHLEQLYKEIKSENNSDIHFDVYFERCLTIIQIPNILIYHAGGRSNISLETVGNNIDKLLDKGIDKRTFIFLSDGPNYRDKGNEKCLKIISSVIDFVNAVTELKKSDNITYSESLEDYCKKKVDTKSFNTLLLLFLPLNIDIQALSDKELTNKEKYLKEMINDTENEFYTKKLKIVNNLINKMVNGNNKDKINDFFTKDNYIKEFLNRLDEMKEKIDTLEEKDIQNIISYSSTNYPSFCNWYTSLASCLSN